MAIANIPRNRVSNSVNCHKSRFLQKPGFWWWSQISL